MKIKKGFRGFEELAVEFVKENEQQSSCAWEQTKETQDRNHDAIMVKKINSKKNSNMAIFVGYSDDVDIWWMEAKYSAISPEIQKTISRYRLDATIVSTLLSENIKKVVFVTNLNISSKTISDIRKALIYSNKCHEVVFYTKSHLECWLIHKDYNFFKKYFRYSQNEFNKLDISTPNHIEEFTIYNIGDNYFRETLDTVYSNFVYEVQFSIFAYKHYTARLKKETNLKILSENMDELEINPNNNTFSFFIKIPNILEFENVTEKDTRGEQKAVLPLSLTYELEDIYTKEKFELVVISNTALKIIKSDYFHLEIPSQKTICDKLVNKTLENLIAPTINFSLTCLSGKSGVGKSFVLQLYKRKLFEKKNSIICYSYKFCGDKLDDIKLLKKFIFNLFFPFIQYEDLDDEYIKALQKANKLSIQFWDFVFHTKDIDLFMCFGKTPNLLKEIFSKQICINNRILIFDDIQKLGSELWYILSELIKILEIKEFPIFCILTSQKEITSDLLGYAEKKYIDNKTLTILEKDVDIIFKKRIPGVELKNISALFGTVIEIVQFIKHISRLEYEIKTIDDFRLAYHTFKNSDLLNCEILSKFETTFRKQQGARELCSCIYYTQSGLHLDIVRNSENASKIIDILLQDELIIKNEEDFYVAWHDYYGEIFRNNFPLELYKGIEVPFKTTHDAKLQLRINYTQSGTVENILEYINKLYLAQKFYSIYYILENVFLNSSTKEQFKYKIRSQNYYMLFAYFCYANANAGTITSGYDMFNSLYVESCKSSNQIVLIIHYIILWELINSLYERGDYDEALEKIYIFSIMPDALRNNWISLFEWDYHSIQYAVHTIEMFINSEKGTNYLNKVPEEARLKDKDVAFSTYRLLLCNLTNDFSRSDSILRKYNKIIQDDDFFDNKTKYMYNFVIKYLDCISNKIDISEVIIANSMLKDEFFNDYNRHIFAIAALALIKRDISLCESYRMEYIKTNRPMKKRQKAFQSALLALINLYNKMEQQALNELYDEQKYLASKTTYLPIVEHNINYVKQYKFSLDDVEFYLGQKLCKEKYYIDIRMLY